MAHWEALAVIASCIVAVLAFLDSWFRRRRDDRSGVSATTRRIEDRITKLEVDQFGSNHGGMREALNKVDKKVDDLDSKVDYLATLLAELRGEIRGHHR